MYAISYKLRKFKSPKKTPVYLLGFKVIHVAMIKAKENMEI